MIVDAEEHMSAGGAARALVLPVIPGRLAWVFVIIIFDFWSSFYFASRALF